MNLNKTLFAPGFLKGSVAHGEGDYETAISEFEPLAKKGNVLAQYLMGVMYKFGQGVSKNLKQAVEWFTLAAEQGDSGAQFTLGLMFKNGNGLQQSSEAAVKWFTCSAKQGNAMAQFMLGLMYFKGEGTAQDDQMAFIWFRVSELNGDKNGKKLRAIVSERISNDEVKESQERVKKFIDSGYKNFV